MVISTVRDMLSLRYPVDIQVEMPNLGLIPMGIIRAGDKDSGVICIYMRTEAMSMDEMLSGGGVRQTWD